MARPVKVVYIIDNLRIGGAQQVFDYLIANLPTERFEPTLINLRRDTDMAIELRASGVDVRSLGLSKFSPGAVPALRSAIREIEPDIVHTNLDFSNTFAAGAALAEGVPVVIRHDQSGCLSRGRSYFIKRALAERLVGAGAHTIAISENVKAFNKAIGVDPATVTVIHNGVDPDRFAPAPGAIVAGLPDGPKIGFVGRIIRRKGLQYLVEAAPRILARVPEARFIVIGDGPRRRKIERQVNAAGLASSFVFLGYQQDTTAFYAAFDVIVVPSTFEPFGLVTIEAMATGRPVVASAVDGIAEIIEDNISGLLTPPGDSRQLADKILRLLLDPQLAADIGDRARVRVTDFFSTQAACRQIVELYERLLVAGQGRVAVGREID